MKKAFLGASMISMAILSGCGDSDSGSATSSAPMPDGVVKTIAELGKCSSSTKGDVMQVLADGSFYRCEDGEWVSLGWEKEITKSSSSTSTKDVSSSSKKPIFDEDDVIETPKSSSSKVVESSSSEEEIESSSSEAEESSSSEEEIESSSSEAEESSSSEEDEEVSSSSPEPDDI